MWSGVHGIVTGHTGGGEFTIPHRKLDITLLYFLLYYYVLIVKLYLLVSKPTKLKNNCFSNSNVCIVLEINDNTFKPIQHSVVCVHLESPYTHGFQL